MGGHRKCGGGTGACKFCGIGLERGCQFFAIFDILTGILFFSAWTGILINGDETKVHLSTLFKIPREVIITCIFSGVMQAISGLMLFYAAGFRSRSVCFVWLVICFPLAVVTINFIKIYESVVVFQLTEEIVRNKVKTDMENQETDKAMLR